MRLRPGRAAGAAGRLPRARGELRAAPLGLTTRGVVLVVVLFALGAAAVYPLREYVSQAASIRKLQAKQQALEAANRQLALEQQRLGDPAYVEQLAERDFHLVHPGEQQWLLTGRPPAAAPKAAAPAPTPTPARPAPWYRRAWRWLTGWAR